MLKQFSLRCRLETVSGNISYDNVVSLMERDEHFH
jgi:hypothetical protein